ncbi:MAG: Ig-like domain-containing protein, partial [Candidatus Uhrbacteria bacterium]
MSKLRASSYKLRVLRLSLCSSRVRRQFCGVQAKKGLCVFASCLLFLFFALPALAQVDTGIEFGTATGLSSTDIRILVARIIRALLGVLGIVALLITLYGGFLWLISHGDEQKITKAKRLLVNGAIGLAIMMLSFSIAYFVLSQLQDALGPGGGGTGQDSGMAGDRGLSGALGAGPIVDHYPPRDANCAEGPSIPTNTRIFVTFREAVLPESFIDDSNLSETYGTTSGDPLVSADNNFDLALSTAIQVAPVGANVDWAKLTPAAQQAAPAAFAAEQRKLIPVAVSVVPGAKTISLTPVQTTTTNGRTVVQSRDVTSTIAARQYLQKDETYIVRLAPSIQVAASRPNGTHDSLFAGAWGQGYQWAFTVCADADTTPPKVQYIFPRAGANEAPNALVQVTFNEAMDPTVTRGPGAYLGVEDVTGSAVAVSGSFELMNGYRTAEFTSTQLCTPFAVNSCGGYVYCLPEDASIRSWMEAAALEIAGEPAGLPFSGVMDAAGNSLDGDG